MGGGHKAGAPAVRETGSGDEVYGSATTVREIEGPPQGRGAGRGLPTNPGGSDRTPCSLCLPCEGRFPAASPSTPSSSSLRPEPTAAMHRPACKHPRPRPEPPGKRRRRRLRTYRALLRGALQWDREPARLGQERDVSFQVFVYLKIKPPDRQTGTEACSFTRVTSVSPRPRPGPACQVLAADGGVGGAWPAGPQLAGDPRHTRSDPGAGRPHPPARAGPVIPPST